jgi:hypothetical protein
MISSWQIVGARHHIIAGRPELFLDPLALGDFGDTPYYHYQFNCSAFIVKLP